jgi:hypothetical protein
MAIVFRLRHALFAALLAVVGVLALCVPALASNIHGASDASGIHAVIGHDECAEPQSPAQHSTRSGVLDCCEWSSVADFAALPWPAGNDSVAAGSPAVAVIRAASRSAASHSPHSRAAWADFIVLFGRFRE